MTLLNYPTSVKLSLDTFIECITLTYAIVSWIFHYLKLVTDTKRTIYMHKKNSDVDQCYEHNKHRGDYFKQCNNRKLP
jgi:hypothetical protein